MILSNFRRRASQSPRQALTWAASALTLAVLAACGGGGGGDAGGGTLAGGSGSAVTPEELSGWWASASKENNLKGSIYTSTLPDCDKPNTNVYALKADVALQGGPQNDSASGLVPEASFHVRVTNPAGDVVLGSSGKARPVETDGQGRFVKCYKLVDLVQRPDGAPGFHDTPNNGNEYKVWISLSEDFTTETKTDNFKVAQRNAPLPPAPTTGSVTVLKFYDADADGQKGADEPYLSGDSEGWVIGIGWGNQTARTQRTFTGLPLQETSVWELMPDQPNWHATNVYVGNYSAPNIVAPEAGTYKMNSIGVTPTTGAPREVVFGNVCTGDDGQVARTIGYWKNKGQELIDQAHLDTLSEMNLRDESGEFDPSEKAQLKDWLNAARAKDMAYMLSAQLAAMRLNVAVEYVKPQSVIYAPGATSSRGNGFATVQEVMDQADALLGTGDGTRKAAERQKMELLKNALDLANNRSNFAMPTPCERSFVNATTP